MDAIDYLYYGFGQVAYSIALSDGKIQREEQEKLHQIISNNFKKHSVASGNTEIIFELLRRESVFSSEETYKQGIDHIKLGGHKLDDATRTCFIDTLEAIAAAFPPTTIQEKAVLDHFIIDLDQVK